MFMCNSFDTWFIVSLHHFDVDFLPEFRQRNNVNILYIQKHWKFRIFFKCDFIFFFFSSKMQRIFILIRDWHKLMLHLTLQFSLFPSINNSRKVFNKYSSIICNSIVVVSFCSASFRGVHLCSFYRKMGTHPIWK